MFPSETSTKLYTINKGTKALIQIHKTLEILEEDNAHHYKFMCFVIYSVYFEMCRGGKTLFSVESSRKRSGRRRAALQARAIGSTNPLHMVTPP